MTIPHLTCGPWVWHFCSRVLNQMCSNKWAILGRQKVGELIDNLQGISSSPLNVVRLCMARTTDVENDSAELRGVGEIDPQKADEERLTSATSRSIISQSTNWISLSIHKRAYNSLNEPVFSPNHKLLWLFLENQKCVLLTCQEPHQPDYHEKMELDQPTAPEQYY